MADEPMTEATGKADEPSCNACGPSDHATSRCPVLREQDTLAEREMQAMIEDSAAKDRREGWLRRQRDRLRGQTEGLQFLLRRLAPETPAAAEGWTMLGLLEEELASIERRVRALPPGPRVLRDPWSLRIDAAEKILEDAEHHFEADRKAALKELEDALLGGAFVPFERRVPHADVLKVLRDVGAVLRGEKAPDVGALVARMSAHADPFRGEDS